MELEKEMRLIEIVFAWFFVIPAVIAVGFFAVMAAAFVMIAFAPFWALSAIVNMFGGKHET